MLLNRVHKGKEKQEMWRKVSKKKKKKKVEIISSYSYSELLPLEHGTFWPADVADDELWRVFLWSEIID